MTLPTAASLEQKFADRATVCGNQELFLNVFHSVLGDTSDKSLLDLCCAECGMTRYIPKSPASMACDVKHWPKRAESENFTQVSVIDDHPIFERHYDIALCFDGVEHLLQHEADRLLERMIAISDAQFLFCPLGEFFGKTPEDPDPDVHKIFLWPDQFKDAGWEVLTFNVWHKEWGDFGAFFAWRSN